MRPCLFSSSGGGKGVIRASTLFGSFRNRRVRRPWRLNVSKRFGLQNSKEFGCHNAAIRAPDSEGATPERVKAGLERIREDLKR